MRLAFFVSLVLISTGCITVKAPTLIDRSTVMESEAAGDWPSFEKEFLDKGPHSGPIPFPKEASSKRKRRIYSILNGDLIR